MMLGPNLAWSAKALNKVVLLTCPLWLAVAWNVAFWAQYRYALSGPFNELALYSYFIAPAVGCVPIVTSRLSPAVKFLAVPVYYVAGFFGAGLIGWFFCTTLHTCS